MKKLFKIVALLFIWFLPAAGHAGDYTYTTNNGTITITKYTGTNWTEIIPDTFEGLPVTSIGTNAFYNKSSLTSVVIPDSVTNLGNFAFQFCGLTNAVIGSNVASIGSNAFNYCRSLTSIVIPDSVINLGGYAFLYCYALTNVTIGSSVAGIGDWAFYCCTNLTGVVTIPASVTSIGAQVFTYCDSLTGITVDDSNPAYFSADGVLFDKNQTMLIQYPGGKDAISYTIPGSVTYIWEAAFYHSTTLVNVTVPTSVTSISNWAFAGCKSLSTITVNAGNPVYLSADGVLFNAAQTALLQYPAGKPSVSYTIPDGVTSVGEAAFHFCANLTGVAIPDSATGIGRMAFNYCTNLTSIVIPDSVINLGEAAFAACYALTNAQLGNSVANIGNSAFSRCTNLTGVYFPGNAPSVGSSIFSGANKATIYHTAEATGWPPVPTAWAGRPTALWEWVPYVYTTNNGKITIIDYTGSGGVVTIPDTINGLPVTSIGEYAFENSASLTSVTISNSVTSIGDGAFYYCTGLTSVTIGSGVTSIGEIAFESCDSLTNITVNASNTAYSSLDGILFNKSQTTLIRCPEGKAGSYTIPNSVTSIGDEAFSGCDSLTSITIPNSVTSIGDYAFNVCTSLASITIPNSVTSIGAGVFSECYRLANVTIPNSVTNIGNGAFEYCFSLTSITIPNSVTSIGTYTFSACTNLTSITIPNSVTNIGNYAFEYCSSLTGVYFLGNAPLSGSDPFYDANSVTVYRLSGATGWPDVPNPWAGRPTALWDPKILAAWDFYGLPGSPNPATATAVVYTVSSAPVLSKVGLGAGGRTNCFFGGQLTNSTLADAVNANKYFAFSLSNTIPVTVSNVSMCIRAHFSPSAPTGFTLRVSSDSGFSIYTDRHFQTDSHAYNNLKAGNLNMSGTLVYFRLYSYGDMGTSTAISGFAGTTNGGVSPAFLGENSGLDGTPYDLIVYGQLTDADWDHDGIPDSWEQQYFGGTTNANPNAVCSNGINTVLQAYIAGLNPTNSSAWFGITNHVRNMIQWTAVSGRFYNVYWTTNLLNAFQLLQTNYTGGTFTDSTHSAAGKCFYKIDVRLGE